MITATPEKIIQHCVQTLKRFKSPSVAEFLDGLPKNLVGKVLKKALRNREGGQRRARSLNLRKRAPAA